MSNYDDLKPDFSQGLLTVILQHYTNKNVLMVGYMNEEAFEITKKEAAVWFYSRSKERLWKKGESSQNVQYVKEMYLDCDQDALLILVDPAGPTCHRNTESYFNIAPAFTLKDIEKIIQDRLKDKEEASYTHYLLTEGTDKIAKKFGEEAIEVIIATKNADKKNTANETADLLYHLGVLLHNQGIAVDDVATVLAERHQKNNNFKGERKDIDVW